MAEFMMLMKTEKPTGDATEWEQYIHMLSGTGLFRGGSALGNGICLSQVNHKAACAVSGFMRFEADSLEQVLELVQDNPVYKADGSVEVLELL